MNKYIKNLEPGQKFWVIFADSMLCVRMYISHKSSSGAVLTDKDMYNLYMNRNSNGYYVPYPRTILLTRKLPRNWRKIARQYAMEAEL